MALTTPFVPGQVLTAAQVNTLRVGILQDQFPTGTLAQRPTGLGTADAGRVFVVLPAEIVHIWSGSAWFALTKVDDLLNPHADDYWLFPADAPFRENDGFTGLFALSSGTSESTVRTWESGGNPATFWATGAGYLWIRQGSGFNENNQGGPQTKTIANYLAGDVLYVTFPSAVYTYRYAGAPIEVTINVTGDRVAIAASGNNVAYWRWPVTISVSGSWGTNNWREWCRFSTRQRVDLAIPSEHIEETAGLIRGYASVPPNAASVVGVTPGTLHRAHSPDLQAMTLREASVAMADGAAPTSETGARTFSSYALQTAAGLPANRVKVIASANRIDVRFASADGAALAALCVPGQIVTFYRDANNYYSGSLIACDTVSSGTVRRFFFRQLQQVGTFAANDAISIRIPQMDTSQRGPPRLSSAPANPAVGDIYYDTTSNIARQWTGSAWQLFSGRPLWKETTNSTGVSVPRNATWTQVATHTHVLRTDRIVATCRIWHVHNLASSTMQARLTFSYTVPSSGGTTVYTSPTIDISGPLQIEMVAGTLSVANITFPGNTITATVEVRRSGSDTSTTNIASTLRSYG